MSDLRRRLSTAIASLDVLREVMHGAAGAQTEKLADTLRACARELDHLERTECCTEGCWRQAAPGMLHCRYHGGVQGALIAVKSRD